MSEMILSICIPSYNRPEELSLLLQSIDIQREDVEIVIREDASPRRLDIRKVVDEYKSNTRYSVNYIENEKNCGYDKNLRSVAQSATGKWIIFMGDDDRFVQHALDGYVAFLERHEDLGYVLRRYRNRFADGSEEDYRYDQKNVFFEPGQKTIIELYRRSLFISGFTFKRECFNDYECSDYDGSLLFQLYILAVICNKCRSCYCDILITEAYEGGIPYFGVSESEKNLYTSGSNSIEGSLRFMSNVKTLSESIDQKLEISITNRVMDSYSKYSYGFLHEHRGEGIKKYKEYVKGLRKLGFDRTYHFNVYYIALLVMGKKTCQKIIRAIKRVKGSTPKL